MFIGMDLAFPHAHPHLFRNQTALTNTVILLAPIQLASIIMRNWKHVMMSAICQLILIIRKAISVA